jgi:hypothetical protein
MAMLVGSFTILLVLLVVPTGLLVLAGRRQRRWEDAIARQILLTDAIHRELGAVAAPSVSRVRGGWEISIPAALDRPELIATLLRITEGMFPPADGPMRVVLTRGDRGRLRPMHGPGVSRRPGERPSAVPAPRAA